MSSIQTIHILHTNDIHSHFEQMPPLAYRIRQLREEFGAENTLTLDIGDHMDRMRIETEGTFGRANVSVMNATGYDAVCLGNNEGLTLEPEVLESIYTGANCSILVANMFETRTGKLPSWMKPYEIFERNGIRVACIGLTIHFQEFYRLLGWDVKEPIEMLQHYIPQMRQESDIIVVLSHLGIRYDERMAEEADVDLILGGHTHHLLDRLMKIRGTWIAAAGKFGQYLGHVRLDWNSDRGRIEGIDGEVISMEDVPPAEDISLLLTQAEQEGRMALSKVVTRLEEPLPIHWSKESRLGNLLADGLFDWVEGADVALLNAGQLLEGLEAGEVHRGRLHEICPSPINPCLLQLTGAQLRMTLEQALLEEYHSRPIRGFGFRGKVLGTLCVSGMEIRYESEKDRLQKITEIYINGKPIADDRRYGVATLDMFTFGVGYEEIQHGLGRRFYLPELLRDVLERALQNPRLLESSRSVRWQKADR